MSLQHLRSKQGNCKWVSDQREGDAWGKNQVLSKVGKSHFLAMRGCKTAETLINLRLSRCYWNNILHQSGQMKQLMHLNLHWSEQVQINILLPACEHVGHTTAALPYRSNWRTRPPSWPRSRGPGLGGGPAGSPALTSSGPRAPRHSGKRYRLPKQRRGSHLGGHTGTDMGHTDTLING